MNPHTNAAAQAYADELVRLANERSRLRHALAVTWTKMGMPPLIQGALLELALDGNRNADFEKLLNAGG